MTENQMYNLVGPYRRATLSDAAALAQFVNIAGEGMPLYLWSKMAEQSGESAWDIGKQRARRESGGFSYRNSIVRDDAGSVVAGLIGYALPYELDPTRFDDMPAMFVPLQELEDRVPGTWYVNVLATVQEHRGKGFGRDLLQIAEKLALEAGCAGLSLIVADTNDGARRLYSREGYEEVAERPMVKDDWDGKGENWVLMRRSLT